MVSPKMKGANPARKQERAFIPISVHLTASAAAKAAGFWGRGAHPGVHRIPEGYAIDGLQDREGGRRGHRGSEVEGREPGPRPGEDGVVEGKSYALMLGLPSFVAASPEGLWIYSLDRNQESLEMQLSPDELEERDEEVHNTLLKWRVP
jgi:hypothetical protein